jgi:alkylation response protein AidB-like acyl-CoA dehydrogenase
MRLEPDDTQRDLALAVRAELEAAAGRGGRLDPAEVHTRLAGLDVYALDLPAAADGLELGLTYAAALCEELGRWAAPDSYRASMVLADLILSVSHDAAAPASSSLDDLLRAIAAGKATAGLAAGVGVVAARTPGGWELDGDCALPGPPPDASFYLVPARRAEGTSLAAVTVEDPGATWVASRRDGARHLRLAGARAHILSGPLHSAAVPAPLLVRARIRQAAYLLGLAAGAHRLAISRAASRQQFGRSIGENQAIAFPLAEQFAELEAVRLLVHQACWAADNGQDAAVGATQALAYAAELALRVTAHAVHVHGAAGLTEDAPVSRHYRAAAMEATRWGAPTSLWREAGALRLR